MCRHIQRYERSRVSLKCITFHNLGFVRCDKDDTHCGLKYFNCIISRKDEDLEYIISLPHLKDRGGECNLNKSAPLCIILPESKMRI